MSPTNRAMLCIRQAILAGSHYSPQSCNGFLGGVSFTSVFQLPQVRNIKEGSGDMLGGVGKTAKSAVTGATEVGQSAMESSGMTGEKCMHTADRTVNSAAETTKNISDKMIVEAEDKVEEESTTHQPTDSSVEDVRTREQGYD